MGCASSKQKRHKLCKKCQEPCTPVRRSYSMYTHQNEIEKFSSLGSFKFDLLDQKSFIKEEEDEDEDGDVLVSPIQKNEEFVMGMVEAKTWSKMIDQKIPKIVPKTPTRTPPGEPETINAWELMEGLEDTSPNKPQIRSFSFNFGTNHHHFLADYPTPKIESIKPIWSDNVVVVVDDDDEEESNSTSNQTSILSDFDPEVIETFRQALQELPPANPFHLKPLINDLETTIKKRDKLILYFTSLRGVRKTYEDCCNVRSILKGLGVKIDERDVSMHFGFKDELKELLIEEGLFNGMITLPNVFVGRRYIGGAEEIRRMHEEGLLEKAVDGCEVVDDGGGSGGGGICVGCNDIRFVPCGTCFGSCKVYYEGDFDDEECEESSCGFQPCLDCNENGLIRCPICCD